MAINYQRASELLLEKQEAMLCDETVRLANSVGKLLDALVGDIPWDWRYNATHWALNVTDVCSEIGYSIAWMRAFAEFSSECGNRERRIAESRVSYYADNAATRISSCRDKLALLAWSYYCPFNPDKRVEILTFEQIRERLNCPVKFGLQIVGHEAFLTELNKLDDSHFQRAIDYRNKKVHRMEPQVMLREPQKSDQTSYMIPLVSKEDIKKFDDGLAEMYPEDDFRAQLKEGCHLNGVLFDRRAPKELLWHIEDFDEFTHACWKSLCDATAGSCEILLAREPLLSKIESSEEC